MCLNPIIDRDGNEIWCRKCKRCRNNRVSDWVGRCIAESRFATSTNSVTLTYGRDENGNIDHIHSALLIYRDVQIYFKRLRKAGYKFKYLVVGEYGSKKRRAHWHLIIFWNGKSPEIKLHEIHQHKYWEWGHSYFDEMTPASIWYVCKYLQKEQLDDEAETQLRMSKKPPIGHEYFQNWARQHVEQGLAPKSLHYSFSDVKHKDGKAKQFYMRGVTADNFIREYFRYFVEKNKHIQMPYSELTEDWLDERYARDFEDEKWEIETEHGKKNKKAQQQQPYREAAALHGGIKCWYKYGSSEYHGTIAQCQDGTRISFPDKKPETQLESFLRIIQIKL